MTTLTVKHFDTIEYMQELKKVKFSEEQAEFLAQKTNAIIVEVLEQAKEEAKIEFNKKDLVTKGDLELAKGELQKEIKELEVRLITQLKNSEIKLLCIFGAGFVALLGVLAKGFGWF